MAERRIFLSSPTMHGEEQIFIKEAFDTNWVAPLGKNVDVRYSQYFRPLIFASA